MWAAMVNNKVTYYDYRIYYSALNPVTDQLWTYTIEHLPFWYNIITKRTVADLTRNQLIEQVSWQPAELDEKTATALFGPSTVIVAPTDADRTIWSDSGKWQAAILFNNDLQIWAHDAGSNPPPFQLGYPHVGAVEVPAREPDWSFSLPNEPLCVAFSPDDSYLAVYSPEKQLIFDTATGQQLHSLRISGGLCPFFSNDGKLIGLASQNAAYIIETESGNIIIDIPLDEFNITYMSLTKDYFVLTVEQSDVGTQVRGLIFGLEQAKNHS